MKTLILGNGWIGNLLLNYLPDSEISLGKSLKDINAEYLKGYNVVINTAAKTNIDWCELNKDEAFDSNTLGAHHVARLCHEASIYHVFISSACIFQSEGPTDIKYEDSEPNPQCFYAFTKWWAEKLMAPYKPLVVRIRLPISEDLVQPRNTIFKILNYTQLIDTQESVTVIEDFLPMIKALIDRRETGPFHVVNEGYTSPHQIADLFQHKHEVISKATLDANLGARAKRVTTLVGSKRIPLLANIQRRLQEIISK